MPTSCSCSDSVWIQLFLIICHANLRWNVRSVGHPGTVPFPKVKYLRQRKAFTSVMARMNKNTRFSHRSVIQVFSIEGACDGDCCGHRPHAGPWNASRMGMSTGVSWSGRNCRPPPFEGWWWLSRRRSPNQLVPCIVPCGGMTEASAAAVLWSSHVHRSPSQPVKGNPFPQPIRLKTKC